MRIGITGAGGLIGRALARAIQSHGWIAIPLSRRPDVRQLESLDAVVHLAGEPIDGRWTEAKKTEIRRSRVEGTRELVRALAECRTRPRVLVSASAVGYYGDRGDEPLSESSHAGNDFLATVCQQWESEALAARQFGLRTVVLRTGIVLASKGGALAKMVRPFAFGFGGPLGNGRQFVPWIALDDIVALYLFAIQTEMLRGAVNAVSPDVATNARLAQAIGAAIRRPALIPAPSFALRAAFGEFAGTVLGSQLVLPSAAIAAGFVWRHRRLENAVRHLLDPAKTGPSPLLHTFSAQQFVPLPVQQIFAFFSDARNLEAITPSSLHFRIASGAAAINGGSVIDYRLHLHGMPLSWKALIVDWDPPRGFVDVQLHGPYALWEHQHTFTEVQGGTIVSDDVTYALPLAPLSAIVKPLVRRDVEHIFRYRRNEIVRRLSAGSVFAPVSS